MRSFHWETADLVMPSALQVALTVPKCERTSAFNIPQVYSKLESKRKHTGQISVYAEPMETMGDRIKYLRGVKGMSQTDLADRVGVTKSAVSQWELGQSANVKLQTFLKLCETLGCLPEFLIYGPSRRPPEGPDSGSSTGVHKKPNFRKS